MKNGQIDKNKKVGEISYNKYGSKMTIVEYINNRNIIIEFDNGYRTVATYQHFQEGGVKSLYDKSVYGIGYLGEGKYKITTLDNKPTKEYDAWKGMLRRCYDQKLLLKRPTYIGCTVCEVWHNFQVFAKWYDDNYYEIDNEKMCLDKDILIKGNKIYSPDTCCIVSNRINVLFTKSDSARGDLPIGVYHDNNIINKLRVCCNENKKSKSLGLFDTPEEAFYLGYKPFKENYIKQKADEYKDRIPLRLYNAMYEYQVEITD